MEGEALKMASGRKPHFFAFYSANLSAERLVIRFFSIYFFSFVILDFLASVLIIIIIFLELVFFCNLVYWKKLGLAENLAMTV